MDQSALAAVSIKETQNETDEVDSGGLEFTSMTAGKGPLQQQHEAIGQDGLPSRTQMDEHSCSSSDSGTRRPSNECILGTAFLSFFSFAMVQICFGVLAAHSDALVGDGAAMIVDAFTYLFSWYAERKKKQILLESIEETFDSDQIRIRTIRKRVLQFEIIPTVLSIVTLLAITFVVLHEAIDNVILDMHIDVSEQKAVDLRLLLIFSGSNLVLDAINVLIFAKARHLFGYATYRQFTDDKASSGRTDEEHENGDSHDEEAVVVHHHRHEPEPLDDPFHSHFGHNHANLNMCSAYTHVIADTLRSLAVIASAVVAMLVPGVSSEEADSTAALCVSALVLVSTVPLFQGLWKSTSEVREIRADERKEETAKNDKSKELAEVMEEAR